MRGGARCVMLRRYRRVLHASAMLLDDQRAAATRAARAPCRG
ncbi:hypothetical protein BURMUCF1_B0206 [Burkholderia multivorans ATCC BAA-247]|nr:hypothetical protein BURMUCF1_B0206 [Burkholderia multivorans ATCC BAA-247]